MGQRAICQRLHGELVSELGLEPRSPAIQTIFSLLYHSSSSYQWHMLFYSGEIMEALQSLVLVPLRSLGHQRKAPVLCGSCLHLDTLGGWEWAVANMNICSVLYTLLCYVSVNLSSCAFSLSLLLETLCSSCHPAFCLFLGESLDSELTFQILVFYFLFLSLFLQKCISCFLRFLTSGKAI